MDQVLDLGCAGRYVLEGRKRAAMKMGLVIDVAVGSTFVGILLWEMNKCMWGGGGGWAGQGALPLAVIIFS